MQLKHCHVSSKQVIISLINYFLITGIDLKLFLDSLKFNSSKMAQDDSPLVLEDFPPGPLDIYRKQATFDWKKLKIYMEDERLLKIKVS